ncbi:MAG: ABC transporter permease subunit [Candidatus Woesearchaeota archaeon]|jgi:microcin C transport system permease protein|nr:ABC transporter permease subunit [Candidatus Woesearchaeota archaeon]
MFTYIIRRFLLMIPTFIGITLIFFVILQIVPGGPLEQEIMKIKHAAMLNEGGNSGIGSTDGRESLISEDAMLEMKKFYGMDKPIYVRYLLWLGLWPRTISEKELVVGDNYRQNLAFRKIGYNNFELQNWVKVGKQDGEVKVYESLVGGDFQFEDIPALPQFSDIKDNEWEINNNWEIEKLNNDSVRIFKTEFSGVFTGNLGNSYEYKESVMSLIFSRVHISLYFGIIGFLLSYFISIPLGVIKAVKNGSVFDMGSSIIVFVGYSVPGFAFGAILLMLFGGGSFWDVFPLGGFRSENFADLSFWGQVIDQVHHTILPICAYAIGSFASMTILMKNSLLENLGKDYTRTAYAKGLSERRVIFVHVLKNSLIPLATGIGGLIGLFLSGSYLIEKTFNIDGIGLLGYQALLNRDYPVSLGFLVIGSLVMLIGNLISDCTYALVDPRIRFK